MLEHYLEIITDPAHTAVEFTFVLLDVLIIDAVRRRIVKHLHRDVAAGRHRKVVTYKGVRYADAEWKRRD
jgi:hypothetical protein